jgi:hypothetical protein
MILAEYIPSPLQLTMLLTQEIGFPMIPPFLFGENGGFPDSRLAGNRDREIPRFPIRPGTGIGVPGAAGRGFPGLSGKNP